MANLSKVVGFDTGFFIRLLQGHDKAKVVWRSAVSKPQRDSLVSCLSFYEIQRVALKGAVDKKSAEALLADLASICTILWLDDSTLLRRAAHIAHGNGMAMADALILHSLIKGGATHIYTTDTDMLAYKSTHEIVML